MKKYYKGYNPDMTCYNGFKFEEGKTYEEDEAIICEKGFHFCENPLDVLYYYPLINDECEPNCFSEIEPLDKVIENNEEKNTKCCSRKIKIGAKLSLNEFIENCFSYINENQENNDNFYITLKNEQFHKLSTSKPFSTALIGGAFSNVAITGGQSHVYINGETSKVSLNGAYSQVASCGRSSIISTSGAYSKVLATGDYSTVTTNGFQSQVFSSGVNSVITSSGHSSQIAASGNKSIISNIGVDGIAKATKGSFITLAEYDRGVPICVKTRKIDGKKIKENTWYKLENGKFVEVDCCGHKKEE